MKQLRKPITKTVSILLALIMVVSLFTVIPFEIGAASGVNYIYRSWDGNKVVEEVRTCTSYTTVDGNSLTWSSGWYVLKNNVNLSRSRIKVTGDVSLILCDGATLTDNKGINVGPGASLCIYGQSENNGKLYIHAYYQEVSDVGNDDALIGGTNDAGDISIHGGTIDLLTGYNNSARYHGAGIGGGNSGSADQIKIFGGNIKCTTHGNDSACIGGGYGAMASKYDGEGIVIYGGDLNLKSSDGAAIGNGKDYTGSTGSIAIYGGTIKADSSVGAGIGGGKNGGNGPINIYGGKITAASTARECGAGIGGGASASQKAPIRILGGTIVAAANKGAGIGGGKNHGGGEIEIANANVICASSGGGAGIGGGVEGSSKNIHIHSNSIVCSLSTTTKSHQALSDLLNTCVANSKMKTDASTYGQAGVCALSLLLDLFDPEYSGCAIGGGNEGSGGTITIEDSTVYAFCGKRAAAIGGGQNKGFDSITISGSKVYARNKEFGSNEEVFANIDDSTKKSIKDAIDGEDGAAIGTGDEAESGGGTITIKNHSDVTAIAGTDAAGIGTGDDCDVTCTINISDSKVEAHGGRYGAGIGGGDDNDSGDITIDNSEIIADSGTDGAGIGGGESGKSDTITITDSTVTARGGGYAAGIGGGDHADGGTTIINRSTVRAYGGTDAAGIGGGEDGDGGHIEIYDSDVYAKGKGYGAGIGAGEDSSGDYCSIFGDSRVEAVSGGDGNVQSIGHGDCGWYVSYTGGTLSLDSHLIVNAGSSANDTSEYLGSSRYNAIWGNKYALIRPCGHPDTGWRYMNEASPYHVKYCKKCGRALGEYEEHIWDADHVCTVCHARAEMHTTTYIEQNNSGEVQKKITAPSFTEYEAPECTNTPDGYEFVCWCLNNDIYFEPGDLRNLNYFDMTVKAVYMPAVEATYIDENGVEQTVTARRIYDTDYKLYLSEGWYIVDSNINLDSSIRYRGDVKLIIADGKTLSFTSYSVSGQDPNENAFWAMDEDNKPSKVTVYGQAQQTGVLDIGARHPFFYDLAVNGCTVKLKDENYPDQGVIGVYKTCTVNRGTLTADRIFCDQLIINGGNVDITNSHSFTESLLGWTKRSDSIRLGYYGDHLRIADGQAFKDENGKIYEGSLTTEQIEALEGKVLTPYIKHDYADPEWVWDNDYTHATAVFRCRDCDDVQEIRAKVTYTDSGRSRTSTARCSFLGEEYTTTQTKQIIFDVTVANAAHGTVTANKTTVKTGDDVKLEITPDEGYILSKLYYTDSQGNKTAINGTGFIMPESDVTVTAEFAVGREVQYIDESGDTRTVWAIPFTSDTAELYGVWYYVDGSITLQSNTPVYGDAKLILCDGAKLNGATSVISLGNSSALKDNTLSIYRSPGENEGTIDLGYIYAETVNLTGGKVKLSNNAIAGTLNVNGCTLTCEEIQTSGDFNLLSGSVRAEDTGNWVISCNGDVNISGGTLYANAEGGYTLSCYGNMTVTGGEAEIIGNVYSHSKDTAVRVSGGAVTVSGELSAENAFVIGGNVTINGRFYAYNDITLGWTNLSDSIYAASYGGAEHIYIADGQELTDGMTVYSGSYDESQRGIFAGRTLTPNFLQHVDRSEPYLNDNGEYIPGVIEHYEQGGNNYAVNADGSMGQRLDSAELSYFDFALLSDSTYQIKRYTGPMDDMTRLEIPKSYKGKAVTVIGESDQFFMDGTGELSLFTLVLNENITTVKGTAFALTDKLTAVEGDTSGLSKIQNTPFSITLPSDGSPLTLNLDYPGRITVDSSAFTWSTIVARVKHATTLSSDGNASGVTYIITDDAHTYGDPSWTWEADHSGATAKFTCTDSRCKHEETVNATVTESDETSKIVYTATVISGGETYTDEQEVNKERYNVTFDDIENGKVSVDKENPFEGEKVTLTVTPDPGYKLNTLTVKDSGNEDVPVAGDQFTMPSDDVTVSATFEANAYDIVYAETDGGWISGVYSANTGDDVELNITPASGYELDTIIVKDSAQHDITVTNNIFTMPAGNVSVFVTFKKKDIAITYETDGNGTLTGADTAQLNDKVPLTATPDDGYALFSLYAVEPEWDDPVNVIDGTLYMIDSPVTVYAEFLPIIPAQAPYIDNNGEYHPGSIEHCENNGYFYAVENGVVTAPLDSVELSYFDFKDLGSSYQISYYTGPTDGLSELVIPKTFNGKPVTVIGNDINDAGDVKCRMVPQGTPGFTLVLNENITEIRPYSFYAVQIAKVEGDTSSLNRIGNYAFSWANSRNGYPLDIRLDYPGKITVGYSIFNHMNVTARINHATTFSKASFSQQSISYEFTDAHIYGDPEWTWADDHSTATAKFTCTDSRCKHEETVDATVTSTTNDGVITYTATAQLDGKTCTDTKTAYSDGVGARLLGYSISLDGDIAVNFYMELDPSIALSDTAYMQFNIPDTSKEYKNQTVMVRDADKEDGYYIFKCRVAAKDMTSTITAQIIDNGKEGTPYAYSVKEYADYLLEHKNDSEAYTKAAPLVEKMLQYGVYAKAYFDNEALDDLGEVEITAPETAFNLPGGVTFEGATLSLKSQTTLSLYFKSSTTLTFSCGDYTVETSSSGGYQIARIRGIAADKLQDSLTLTVKAGEENGSVTYSPMNYCHNALGGGTDNPKLLNVVKALAMYAQAANEYFKPNQDGN